MAQTFSTNFSKPQFMAGDGCAATWISQALVTSATQLTATSTLEFPIPGGAEVADVQIQTDDLDSGAAIVFSVGYAPVKDGSTLTAAPAYFAAAGQTTAQAGGRLRCAFQPVYFKEPAKLVITVGTAPAGLAAGIAAATPAKVTAIVSGNCVGMP